MTGDSRRVTLTDTLSGFKQHHSWLYSPLKLQNVLLCISDINGLQKKQSLLA